MNLLKYSEAKNTDIINLLGEKIDLSKRILIGRTTVYSVHPRIYDVKPLDNTLPNFNIKFKSKKTGNLIIAFKLKNSFLNTSKNKLQKPEGMIIDVIGLEKELNLPDILIRHFNLKPKKKNIKPVINNKQIERMDLTRLNTISIDPSKSTKDIDDAISIEYHLSNKSLLTIGVHIANPTDFLDKKTILDRADTMVESLYPYNKKTVNLWGDTITEFSSLKENEKKPCLSLLVKVTNQLDKYQIKDITLKPSCISNKKNLSYESSKNNQLTKELMNITRKLDYNKTEIKDTHDLIAYWMIFYNHYIGTKFKDILPHRVHNVNISDSFDNLNDNIKSVFRNRSMESAYYSLNEYNHDSMNKVNMTHASSPIRRLFDTCIHWYVLYQENLFTQSLINQINSTKKNISKFNNQNKILEWIDKINDSKIFKLIIYQIKNNYCEGYNEITGFLKFEIIPNKLQVLYSKTIIEKDNNIEQIIYIKDDHKIDLKIGEEIEIIIKKKKGFLPTEKFIVNPNYSFNFL